MFPGFGLLDKEAANNAKNRAQAIVVPPSIKFNSRTKPRAKATKSGSTAAPKSKSVAQNTKTQRSTITTPSLSPSKGYRPTDGGVGYTNPPISDTQQPEPQQRDDNYYGNGDYANHTTPPDDPNPVESPRDHLLETQYGDGGVVMDEQPSEIIMPQQEEEGKEEERRPATPIPGNLVGRSVTPVHGNDTGSSAYATEATTTAADQNQQPFRDWQCATPHEHDAPDQIGNAGASEQEEEVVEEFIPEEVAAEDPEIQAYHEVVEEEDQQAQPRDPAVDTTQTTTHTAQQPPPVSALEATDGGWGEIPWGDVGNDENAEETIELSGNGQDFDDISSENNPVVVNTDTLVSNNTLADENITTDAVPAVEPTADTETLEPEPTVNSTEVNEEYQEVTANQDVQAASESNVREEPESHVEIAVPSQNDSPPRFNPRQTSELELPEADVQHHSLSHIDPPQTKSVKRSIRHAHPPKQAPSTHHNSQRFDGSQSCRCNDDIDAEIELLQVTLQRLMEKRTQHSNPLHCTAPTSRHPPCTNHTSHRRHSPNCPKARKYLCPASRQCSRCNPPLHHCHCVESGYNYIPPPDCTHTPYQPNYNIPPPQPPAVDYNTLLSAALNPPPLPQFTPQMTTSFPPVFGPASPLLSTAAPNNLSQLLAITEIYNNQLALIRNAVQLSSMLRATQGVTPAPQQATGPPPATPLFCTHPHHSPSQPTTAYYNTTPPSALSGTHAHHRHSSPSSSHNTTRPGTGRVHHHNHNHNHSQDTQPQSPATTEAHRQPQLVHHHAMHS
ncbi:hypothetical protein Pelo_5521 [Pelomyxa schiedti]|nr:hypothetical protein Pelo_5521 [Pelomyxa schiedti]